MLYKERLQSLVKSEDPFWIDTIAHFIEATYESKEQGISDLEELAKDRTRFNEFTKQIVKRKDDLKSVKAEFLEDINNNYIKNINSIAEKIVEKIQKLDANEVASLTTLLDGNEYDSKMMFDIYDTTVKKLKEVRLYLNFGKYENQRAGLPFNLPFKKGYIKKVIISSRLYHGIYGKGSIFSDVTEFNLEGGNAISKSYIEFCIDEKIKNSAKIESIIPFSMSEEEIANLNELLKTISNDFQAYSEEEMAKISISPKYFEYTDVKINESNYSVNSDNEILTKLRIIIKSNLSYKAISKAYDELVKNNFSNEKF